MSILARHDHRRDLLAVEEMLDDLATYSRAVQAVAIILAEQPEPVSAQTFDLVEMFADEARDLALSLSERVREHREGVWQGVIDEPPELTLPVGVGATLSVKEEGLMKEPIDMDAEDWALDRVALLHAIEAVDSLEAVMQDHPYAFYLDSMRAYLWVRAGFHKPPEISKADFAWAVRTRQKLLDIAHR